MRRWGWAAATAFVGGMIALGARATPQPATAPWTLNEVSVLIPLPTRAELGRMLAPDSAGAHGPLLPRAVYDELPRLILGGNPDLIYREQLRVVAMRIDPCFHEGPAPLACRRQLRLVWQPLEFSARAPDRAAGDAAARGEDRWSSRPPSPARASALDAAVHSFYDFDETEWRELLRAWRPAARAAGDRLEVHPTLAREGLDGPAWSRLRDVVLGFAGEARLSRATGMNVDPLGSLWVFAGVDVDRGVHRRIRIPRVDRGAQGLFIDPTRLTEFRASLNPYPEGQIGWLNLLHDSESRDPARDRDELREALAQAARIENPRLENTGGIDCVSCHVAQSVRLWGERRGLDRALRADLRELIYPEKAASADAATGFINRLRAFGYFLDEINISRRTLNESLEVTHRLNTETF